MGVASPPCLFYNVLMIKGFRGTSLVDYPGKISSVIFTYTCNYRCPYCYNLDLVLPERFQNYEDIPEELIIKELQRRKGFIKGVVITGGEPTLWGDRLISFIENIVLSTQLPVKLDTNASNPEVLELLIESGLIDLFAVDLKTSPERYKLVGGDFERVKKSLEMLKRIPHKVELRITCYPPLIQMEDIEKLIPYIKGFKKIALQKFVPEETLSGEQVTPYSQEVYESFETFIRKKLPEVEVIKRYQ